MTPMDLADKKIVISGSFDFITKSNLEQRLRNRGAKPSKSKSADLILAGHNAKQDVLDNAASKDIQVIEHDDVEEIVGPPLYRYIERLEHLLDAQMSTYDAVMIFKHIGDPADEEAIAKAEETLGVDLDPALKSLYRQANGITIGYRQTMGDEEPSAQPRKEGPFDHNLFMDSAPKPELWEASDNEFRAATLNIPTIENLFASPYSDFIGSNEDMMIGNRSNYVVYAEDLFLFDATYGYQPIYLGVVREKETFRLAVGHDHAAAFTDFATTSLESYFEKALKVSPALSTRTFRRYDVTTWWEGF